MRIANNVPALLTHINLRRNDRILSQHMNRLSTGLRINSAREDAAGMAIANKLTFQLVGLERASDNSWHGISVIQTAEGALNEVHAMLQRIRELSVQAANDTNVPEDRMAMQREINNLIDEVTALSGRSEFNTIKLLNGEAARVSTSWVNGFVLPDGTPLDAVLTRTLATPLFISHGTPAGTLRYTILSPAQPAQLVGNPIDSATTDWTRPISELPEFSNMTPPFSGGTIRINGINVYVQPHHTMDIIWQNMVNASEYSGVNPSREINNGLTSITMTSIRNGAHEQVELSGNATIWNLFGMYIPPTLPAWVEPGNTAEGEGYAYVASGDALNPEISGINIPPPAVFPLPPLVPYDVAAELSGVISINGWPIRVTPDMTIRQIFNAIYNAGNLDEQRHRDYGVASWDVEVFPDYGVIEGDWRIVPQAPNTDPIVILADSDELLTTIFGPANPALLGRSDSLPPAHDLFMRPAPSASRHSLSANGADVDVHVEGLFRNNDLSLPVTDFNNSMAVTTSGNRITVTSAQGHRIEINTHIPTIYRGQIFAQVANMLDASGIPIVDSAVLNGTVPASLLAGTTSLPEGIITINGVAIDLAAIAAANPANPAGAIVDINTALPAGVTLNFIFPDSWSLVSTDPIILGGSAEVWQAIGTPMNELTPMELDMELRIEEFGGLRVQIGPNYNMNMDIQIPRINAETLGLAEFRAGSLVRLVSVTTWEGTQRAIDQSDVAIRRISLVRSRLGAYQNRLEHTIRNLDNAALNTETARSRVQDADMAREMTQLSKRNVMYQAGLAILAQANQRPQLILQLLQ